MKKITRKQWDKAPAEHKKIYDKDTFYMVYKESDGSTCFGPVRIID